MPLGSTLVLQRIKTEQQKGPYPSLALPSPFTVYNWQIPTHILHHPCISSDSTSGQHNTAAENPQLHPVVRLSSRATWWAADSHPQELASLAPQVFPVSGVRPGSSLSPTHLHAAAVPPSPLLGPSVLLSHTKEPFHFLSCLSLISDVTGSEGKESLPQFQMNPLVSSRTQVPGSPSYYVRTAVLAPSAYWCFPLTLIMAPSFPVKIHYLTVL